MGRFENESYRVSGMGSNLARVAFGLELTICASAPHHLEDEASSTSRSGQSPVAQYVRTSAASPTARAAIVQPKVAVPSLSSSASVAPSAAVTGVVIDVGLGLIGEGEYGRLSTLWSMRNDIAHHAGTTTPSPKAARAAQLYAARDRGR